MKKTLQSTIIGLVITFVLLPSAQANPYKDLIKHIGNSFNKAALAYDIGKTLSEKKQEKDKEKEQKQKDEKIAQLESENRQL